MKEKRIIYKGDLFEIISTVTYSEKANSVRVFEKAHRPPGVRMLFRDGDKILMSKEFRNEINDWDYRLPGGKVFDDFASYASCLEIESELNIKIRQAVLFESKQEVGLVPDIDKAELIYRSVAGASVIWDLYYFEIRDFAISPDGQELEEGEQIEKPVWLTMEEVQAMCLSGRIKEDRTVAVLLRYILNSNPCR